MSRDLTERGIGGRVASDRQFDRRCELAPLPPGMQCGAPGRQCERSVNASAVLAQAAGASAVSRSVGAE
jgi:hypothetical protein